jgi:hypothetical protein
MRIYSPFNAALSALVVCCSISLAQSAPSQEYGSESAKNDSSGFHEQLIAQVARDAEVEQAVIGLDHVAWVEKRDRKRAVQLEGKQQGGTFDEVKYLNLHDTRVGFFGKRDSAWIFVLDGQERAMRYKKSTSIEFQPHGSSYAYGACMEKSCRLTLDGVETGAEYEDISYPQYSSDGKHIAFFGKRQKKWIAVVDGKEFGGELEDLWFSAWGFAGKGNFYVAGFSGGRIKGGWMYIVDGIEGPRFDVISPISFTADGHYAYAGATVKAGFKHDKPIGTIVLDGKTTGSTYEGQKFGGMLNAGETMIGGVKDLHASFHGVSTPDWTPDGKLAYAARRDQGEVAVFIDGKAGSGFDEVLSPLAFANDPGHYAYVAKSGDDFITVIDGHPGARFSAGKRGATDVGWIALGDKDHLAFEAVSGGWAFKGGQTARALRSVVLDGVAQKQYDALNITYFDLDNDGHYSYVVRGASGNNDLINIDGHESRVYSDVVYIRSAAKGKNGTYVARDGGKFVRVTYSSVPTAAVSITPASSPPPAH